MPKGREGVSEVQETPGDETESAQEIETPDEEPDTGSDEGGDSDSSDEDKYDPNESTTETVRKALEKAKAEASDGDENKPGERKEKAPADKDTTGVKKPQQQQQKQQETEASLLPPERLNQAERELYNSLPKGLKRGVHRMVKDLEAKTSQIETRYQRATEEAEDVVKAVKPYIAEWGERGLSAGQAIAALAAAQMKLTNPETKIDSYIRLGRDLKIDFEQLAKIAKGEQTSSQPGGEQPHHQNSDLTNRIDRLESELNRTRVEPVASQGAEQMRAVRYEIDETTRDYRYPELLDDNYLMSLKPRVSEIIGRVPNANWGEALRTAHLERQAALQNERKLNGNPESLSQTRLPATKVNSQQTNRAVTGAVSVRGRSNPVTTPKMGDIPAEALTNDPADSVRWAIKQARQGG